MSSAQHRSATDRGQRAHWRRRIDMTGALVVGRRLFDFTEGWAGVHPMDKPVVVLSHTVPDGWPREGAPLTFVSEGIEAAIETAKELAGDKVVGVNGGTMIEGTDGTHLRYRVVRR